MDILLALEKLPEDIRDFSHHTVFGTTDSVPLIDFSVSQYPQIVLDQKDLDFCTSFSSSEMSFELQESKFLSDYLMSKGQPYSLSARALLATQYGLVSSPAIYLSLAMGGSNGIVNLQLLGLLIQANGDYFDPLYQMSKIKQIRGEFTQSGANLRDACQAAQKYGSIYKNQSPFTYQEGKSTDQTRDFLADWLNWPLLLDSYAAKNKIGSFFSADGPYDPFTNFRSILYTNFLSNIQSDILFGLNWRDEWTLAPNGIINDTYSQSAGGGHCVRIRGQKIIEGVPYLVVPNTWGPKYGNNGVFYFPQNVINLEASAGFGAYTFKKMSVETAKYYNEAGISANDNWLIQGLKILKKLL